MKRIKALNALFDNDDHHDSHEFLTWLLNFLHDEILAWSPKDGNSNKQTFISKIFEGKLVSRTRCLECECGNERDEVFMALSVDIENGSSLN
jgi:ubiquitin C-terminal hydrolase